MEEFGRGGVRSWRSSVVDDLLKGLRATQRTGILGLMTSWSFKA